MKILFIVKKGDHYSAQYNDKSGLLNSARFVVDFLNESGVESKVVIVNDNNDIDREVFNYKPTHVIIEALWVVPEKFEVLTKLHPHVRWVIRIHSNTPFLSQEGIAVEWLKKYSEHDKVFIASNSKLGVRDIEVIIGKEVLYLPNIYPLKHRCYKRLPKNLHTIKIACMGAIRPLKNQLIQAVAAIEFAEQEGKRLEFHINSSRNEGGDSVLKNLRSLFSSKHKLVEHGWMARPSLMSFLRTMDIGMQVSLTETFNIMSADYIDVGLPIVVSQSVPWAIHQSIASPTNSDDIVNHLRRVYNNRTVNSFLNFLGLFFYLRESKRVWLDWSAAPALRHIGR